ncbi:MAG: ribosome biogenesis GTPase Der [Acidimicrobiales bacterium]
MRPIVAVVGRPNVGKSTLVNRIVGRREAIVEKNPGVTRDRKAVDADWCGRLLTVVDTGGWLAGDDPLDRQVSHQAERAVAEADLVLVVMDAAVGATAEDEAVARLLRRSTKPIVLVANKVDSDSRESDAWSLSRLGLGDPWPVSALHGRGTGDLLDEVIRLLPAESGPDARPGPGVTDGTGAEGAPGWTAEARGGPSPGRAGAPVTTPRVAIAGRPNVGKSTLFNRLVGDERSIVHDMPGTTRDAIDTLVETPHGPFILIDTAGMRRRSRVDQATEYYSIVRALQAIDGADLAVLVIDAGEGITAQDQRLAERIDGAGCPIVVLLNKWELLDAEGRAVLKADVADRLAFLAYAPVLTVSARSGLGVHKLVPALANAVDAYHRRVPTAELNKVLQSAQANHPSPGGRVLYATQGATDPPTFTLFTSRALPAPYLRYLERRIREHFGFGPTPLKLRVRRRDG